ncbi:cytochrome c oxidase copper chaperone [Arapaima gigas]
MYVLHQAKGSVTMSSLSAASCASTPAGGTAEEKKPLKPCCACPETKKARDACIIEKASEQVLRWLFCRVLRHHDHTFSLRSYNSLSDINLQADHFQLKYLEPGTYSRRAARRSAPSPAACFRETHSSRISAVNRERERRRGSGVKVPRETARRRGKRSEEQAGATFSG